MHNYILLIPNRFNVVNLSEIADILPYMSSSTNYDSPMDSFEAVELELLKTCDSTDIFTYDLCFGNDDVTYEIGYSRTKKDDPNFIASIMLPKSFINGNVCIMKYCGGKSTPITMSEVYDILVTKMVHKGLLVCDTGSIEGRMFHNEYNNINYSSVTLQEYVGRYVGDYEILLTKIANCTIVVYRNNMSTRPINKLCTALTGRVVRGDSFVVIIDHEVGHVDIDEVLLRKFILMLHSVPYISVTNTDDPKPFDYWKLIAKYHKPSSCTCGVIEELKDCTGCYRKYYCSTLCQLADYEKHKIICDYSKNA